DVNFYNSHPRVIGEFDPLIERSGGRPVAACKLTNTEENSLAIGAARPRLPAGYAEFLDDIVAAAQQFGFDPEKSPGRDEPRRQSISPNGLVKLSSIGP